ncbi:MAG: tetratricopeptide repeat protein [Oscillospiraceae bacterium]
MAQQVVEIKCPSCGAPVSTGQTECIYCHNPVIISTFNSVYNMSPLDLNKYANSYRKALAENPDNQELNNSIAMCYLKLKLYDKALPAFEKAMEDNFDNSETFFYAAICLLGGKKAFVAMRPTIDKILEYINAALMIEPRGIYYYFLAYIKYDYFSRKYFKTSPTYQEALAMASQAGYSPYDVEQLFAIMGVDRPSCL